MWVGLAHTTGSPPPNFGNVSWSFHFTNSISSKSARNVLNIISVSVLSYIGKLSGSTYFFNFPGNSFYLTFTGGKLTINGNPVKLMISTKLGLSTARDGFVKFTQGGWTWYIKFEAHQFNVAAFNQYGQKITGVVTKGIPQWSKYISTRIII